MPRKPKTSALTEKQLKALIVMWFDRWQCGVTSREAEQLNHTIVALSVALTGNPVDQYADTKSVYDHCGIPCGFNKDGTVHLCRDWLEEHGFKVSGKKFRYASDELKVW